MDLDLYKYWPLWFICAGMILAAIIDGWKRKVPNWLTFSLILSGWLLATVHSFGLYFGGQGEILSSLAGTALGFALFLPILFIQGMGEGDVKMQMAFGAWVGAFYGLEAGSAVPYQGRTLSIITYSFCAGVIAGGVIAIIMMIWRWNFRHNLENVKDIVTDIATGEARGNERRAREPKLPYGIPLCIGYVGWLVYLHVFAT